MVLQYFRNKEFFGTAITIRKNLSVLDSLFIEADVRLLFIQMREVIPTGHGWISWRNLV